MLRRSITLAVLVLAVLGLMIASAAGKSAPRVVVKSAKIGKYGTVLVNARGYALYVFQPDNGRAVTCTSSVCQTVWPPLKATGDPKAEGSVKQKLLGSDPDKVNGGRVVTYDGWPLYTFAGDTKPGEATGQNKLMNGGYWWVITPAGKIIKVTYGKATAPIVGD